MVNKSKFRSVFILLIGAVASCTHQEVSDDFTKLRTFQADLVQLSVDNPKMRSFPQLETKLAKGQVVAISIRGRGMTQLPKSIYQFQHLTELSLEETAFSALPDLTPFTKLNALAVRLVPK